MLFRSDNIPSFEEVHAEALKAERFLAAAELNSRRDASVTGEVRV